MEREQLPKDAQVNVEKWYQITVAEIRSLMQGSDINLALTLATRRREGLERFLNSEENQSIDAQELDDITDSIDEVAALQAEIEEKLRIRDAE